MNITTTVRTYDDGTFQNFKTEIIVDGKKIQAYWAFGLEIISFHSHDGISDDADFEFQVFTPRYEIDTNEIRKASASELQQLLDAPAVKQLIIDVENRAKEALI